MISVITPTYNCANYLLRSFECLKRQSFQDWEWVIVDDGSVDSTPDILSSIKAQDKRVKVFTLKENQGRGFARNHAVNKSSGSIIAVWDVDDLYLSNRLYEINCAIDAGYDYFCSYTLLVDNNLNLKGGRHFLKDKYKFRPSFVHPTLAFKSDIKDRVKYDKTMRAGEDIGVMLQLENSYNGYYCDKYLLIYSEDREVNLSKAIDANLNQYKAVFRLVSNNLIDCSFIDKTNFFVSKALKIIFLMAFSIKPGFYLKTVKFRASEYVACKKLDKEHLFLLSGGLNE